MENVSVICSGIKGSGNIGSIARAMKNMGFYNLILVSPRTEIDSETRKMAVGAFDIVEGAKVYHNLNEVLSEFNIIFGTSARRGKLRQNILTPREMAELIVSRYSHEKVGILFGTEESGLSRDELFHCDYLVRIPTVRDFKSLNISHAVLLMLYEIFLKKSKISKFSPDLKSKPSSSGERELLFNHVEDVLLRIGFLHSSNPKRIMFTIRQIFSRAGLSKRDVQILHGIFSQVEVILEKCGESGFSK